jgi:hypothetical protein
MKTLIKLGAAACLFASASAAQATTTINFDTGTNGAAVGSFYSAQGITFSNARFASNFSLVGSTPPLGIASLSASFQYVFGLGDAIVATFTGLASKVTIRGIDVGNAGVRIDAFDASNTQIATASDFGLGLGVGTFKDITVTAAGIKSFKLYQPLVNGDDGVIFDNLSFDTVAAVPEPTTWAMLILGMGIVGGTMRRRRSLTAFA